MNVRTAVICLSPYGGGMEMDAVRIARLLSTESFVVLIVKRGSFLEEYARRELENKPVSVISVPFRSAFSLSIILRVRHLVRKRKVRNVIFFGASELRSLYFAFLGLNINLAIRHGTTKTRPKKDPFHRLIYRNVAWHVSICQHLERNVAKIIPFGPKTRSKVIYPSLRQIPLSEPGLVRSGSGPVRILHVGRIADGKGQWEAALACDVLFRKKQEFVLRLVGDFDEGFRKRFMAMVESLPYRDAIEFPGFCRDMAPYYRESDIFLFPSKGEGLSNSFIEALSYGLTCISYDNTSFPELREMGFEFDMAKDQDLDDLQRVLGDATDRAGHKSIRMERNVELAAQMFSPQRELDEYLEIIK